MMTKASTSYQEPRSSSKKMFTKELPCMEFDHLFTIVGNQQWQDMASMWQASRWKPLFRRYRCLKTKWKRWSDCNPELIICNPELSNFVKFEVLIICNPELK